MKISIIGTGYVGLVTGVCLAEKGHEAVCVDVDKRKIDIELLTDGGMAVFERKPRETVPRRKRCQWISDDGVTFKTLGQNFE